MYRGIRTVGGWLLTITGFLACPCHLVVTLPIAVALLGGTSLGGWIATHQGAIALGASIYFVGALALGGTLLIGRRAGRSVPAITSARDAHSQCRACDPA